MQAPDLAIEELRRCVNELNLAGIQIGTNVNEWNLDAPELFPIFEVCSSSSSSSTHLPCNSIPIIIIIIGIGSRTTWSSGFYSSVGYDGTRQDARLLATLARRNAC
jgi:hypothetical protein